MHYEILILILVLGLGFLIIGPKKLPEMGSAIGKTIREFQKSMSEVKAPEKTEQAEPKQIAASTSTTDVKAE